MYQPLLARLSPRAREAFLGGNYRRIFDLARRSVRAWEAAHLGQRRPLLHPSPASGDAPVW
jgi:hypothetical protein